MVIKVNLHTILQKHISKGNIRHIDVELPPGSSLADLLILLNISIEPDLLLFVINGKLDDKNYEINNKDIVDIIPAISGGEKS